MARPKKDVYNLRIHQVNIRLTQAEQEFAIKQAELAGLSIANWLRNAAFSKKALKVKVSPLHKAYYKQLIGVSTNINQIARKVNQNQFPKVYSELLYLRKLLENINSLFHK